MNVQLKKQILHVLAWWAGLFAWLAITHPDKLPVFMLIVPFAVLLFALHATWVLVAHIYSKGGENKQPTTKHTRVSWIASASLVGLLGMQSLGQLTIRDALTVGALLTIGYFYVSRSSAGQRGRT